MKFLRFLLLLIILHAVFIWFQLYQTLPDSVISQVNGSGQPVGTMAKNAFMILHLGLLSGMAILFGMPKQIFLKIPTSLWNIPNREYWLSNENKSSTFDKMESMMLAMGVAVCGFIHYMVSEVILINLGKSIHTSKMVLLTVAFVLFCLIWSGWFFFQFRKPKT